MDFEWTALLAEQRVQALLKDALATEMELLPLSAKLAKTYAPAERAAIMDYYALLPASSKSSAPINFCSATD